jgi:hypothetical protein
MSEKKIVNRNIAIALGTICVLLVVTTAYFSITTISAQDSYNNLQNQNKQLHTWLTGNKTLVNQTSITAFNSLNSTYYSYISTHSHTDSAYNSLSVQNTNLQNQVNNLSDIVNLNRNVLWVNKITISNTAGNVARWAPSMSVSYAGYIGIQINSLTGNNDTYVEVRYSSPIYGFDIPMSVGKSGSLAFPVLPTTNLEVLIGTTDGSAATETVTIVYFY